MRFFPPLLGPLLTEPGSRMRPQGDWRTLFTFKRLAVCQRVWFPEKHSVPCLPYSLLPCPGALCRHYLYRTWIGGQYSNYTKFHDTVQKPTLGLYSVREREEEIHSSSGWCVRSVFLIPSAESRPYWPIIYCKPSQLSCGACKPHPFRQISFVLPTTQEYCTLLSSSHGRGTLQNWRLVAECS